MIGIVAFVVSVVIEVSVVYIDIVGVCCYQRCLSCIFVLLHLKLVIANSVIAAFVAVVVVVHPPSVQAKQSMAHEVTLHVAFVHSFVNPALFMVLHR